jgi:3-deoxy-D-manno-octulosonic-acid transferase
LLKNDLEYKDACKASKDYVYANKGATEKILNFIQEKRLLTN